MSYNPVSIPVSTVNFPFPSQNLNLTENLSPQTPHIHLIPPIHPTIHKNTSYNPIPPAPPPSQNLIRLNHLTHLKYPPPRLPLLPIPSHPSQPSQSQHAHQHSVPRLQTSMVTPRPAAEGTWMGRMEQSRRADSSQSPHSHLSILLPPPHPLAPILSILSIHADSKANGRDRIRQQTPVST